MSQRSAFGGSFLCILALVAALPAGAQITFAPSPATVAVREVSPPITANVTYVGTGQQVGGVQTLRMGYDYILPNGITTLPSPITFTTSPGQTSATVTFRLVAEPWAIPGYYSLPAIVGPDYAYGTIDFILEPVSITPGSVTVTAGTSSDTLATTLGFGYSYPQGAMQLYVSGLPDGASTNPNPVPFDVQSTNDAAWTTTRFRVDTSPWTPPGSYVVSVGYDIPYVGANGASGSIRPLAIVTDTFVLNVRPPGYLTATPRSAAINLCAGGPPVPNAVVVEAFDGYSGSPWVSFPDLPPDIFVTPRSLELGSVPPTQVAEFEVSALSGALPGPRVVTVQVNDSNGPSVTTTFVANVGSQDFDAALSTGTVALSSGGPASTVTAGIAPGACAPPERIRVTPTGLPAGVTATPSTGELVAPDYAPVAFSLQAASGALAASVTAGVLYEPSVGSARTEPLNVTVSRIGTIAVEVERASVDVCPGGPGAGNSLAISTLEGYAGTPTVTFPGLPAGLSVSPDVIAVPPVPPTRVVPFVVTAAPGTPAGPATVTALVSDARGLSTSVTFVANVLAADFTPAVAPGGALLNAGGAPAALVASLVPGVCVPTSDVVVTPSGLPPGVTVTPTSAVLAAPAFAPATFTFLASTSAAPGTSTVTFAFDPAAGGAPKAVTATVTVCGPPEAPASPTVRPVGNPLGPVTATDFLDLSWGAPASGPPPTRYEWRINGGTWNAASALSATAPPRGAVDPVQLFVRGFACSPEKGPGAEASSPVYPLAAPVASFSFPTPVVAGSPVTFTDTSSPQATSWLWFPGDGMAATTVQSPTVTFPAAGPKVVVLVATNGSGSSTKSVTVTVQAASSAAPPPSVAFRAMEREPDGRLALGRVEVEPGTTLLLRRLSGEGEAVAFLRLLDADGQVVVERRLVLADGEEARHDLSAWGANGAFRVEVVGPAGIEAVVEERAIPFGGPEEPVKPVRPAAALR